MKKHFLFAALAMTACFTACSNEDPINQEKTDVPVSFTIGGIDSRATTSATDFSTTFDNGDAIGISGTNVSTEMENVKYNVSVSEGIASITAANNEEFNYGDKEAIFNAYYPYATDFAGTFAVQTDQNADKGLAKSDFLTATAKGSKDNAQVQLDFKHRLVLVQVQLSGISDVASVTLKNAQTNITFTEGTDGTTQGSVALVSGENATSSDIIMSEQTDNTLYWAIIPAQTIAASNLFIVSTSDGKSYKYTTSEATTFAEGTYAQYKLTLGSSTPASTLVDYKPVTISKWATGTAGDENGTLEEDITIYTITNRNQLPETESWGVNSATAEHKSGKINVTGAETAASWYNNTLYYYAGKDFIAQTGKEYKVTIKGGITEDATTNCKLQIVILNKEKGKINTDATSDTDLVFATGTNKNTLSNYVTITTTDKTFEKIIYFYPSYKGTTTSGTTVYETQENGDVVIAIAPIKDNTNNDAYYNCFYIENISIEEIANS